MISTYDIPESNPLADSIQSNPSSPTPNISPQKISGRMGVHPAASAWGASGGQAVWPRWKRCSAPFIDAPQKHDNTAKELVPRFFYKSFAFNALVAFSATQILKLFATPARPLNRNPFNFVSLARPERHRQFGLRKITRSTVHRPALRMPAVKNPHHSSHCVAIRFCSLQSKTNAAVSRRLIIPI